MKKLTDDFKLTARTAADVVDEVNLSLARLQRAGVKFRGRKVGIEGFIGAVVIDFLAKGFDEQRSIITGRLVELETMLGDHDPGQTRDSVPFPVTPKPGGVKPPPVIQSNLGPIHPVKPKAKRSRRSQS